MSHRSVLCQQVHYNRTTGLHTVLTTEPLRSDISFGLVLFPKGYDSASMEIGPCNVHSGAGGSVGVGRVLRKHKYVCTREYREMGIIGDEMR